MVTSIIHSSQNTLQFCNSVWYVIAVSLSLIPLKVCWLYIENIKITSIKSGSEVCFPLPPPTPSVSSDIWKVARGVGGRKLFCLKAKLGKNYHSTLWGHSSDASSFHSLVYLIDWVPLSNDTPSYTTVSSLDWGGGVVIGYGFNVVALI